MKRFFLPLLLIPLFFAAHAEVNVVFIGNSITHGALLDDPATQAPPVHAAARLQAITGEKINMHNAGVSGTTTTDWLPQTDTYFTRMTAAADSLARNGMPMIFSISLGTNESASTRTLGGPMTAPQYATNLRAITDALRLRYPACRIVVQYPIWYSENTYNGATYLLAGLNRLRSYFPAIGQAVASYGSDATWITAGNPDAFDEFSRHAGEWYVPESGNAGTFYLHPNAEGARRLGDIWAAAIAPMVTQSSPLVLNLWDEHTPAPTSLTVDKPETMDHNGHIENVSTPTLAIYRAAEAKNKGVSVIICPGGAYYLLSYTKEGTRFAEWLAENGITAAVLKYRLPDGNHRIPAEDASRAFRLMRDNAATLGIDTAKIGIMGFSAGGHLAGTMTVHGRGDARPAFGVLMYPVLTMQNDFTHKGTYNSLLGDNPSRELTDYYSCERQVTPQTPPVLIMASYDDGAVDVRNSQEMFAALRACKVPVSMYIFPTGGHGWGFRSNFRYHEPMKQLLLDWLSNR